MKGFSTASSSSSRSESEKEKTKLRERQRRAITGKIFHGLRKHGGYRLSPRADINEVLRNLAAESGWTVHSDGTTFRSSSSVGNCCSVCGAARPSATPTPTSSAVLAGGGECSTTASPRHFADGDIPTSFYGGVIQQFESYSGSFVVGDGAFPVAFQHKLREEEARASNQSTPIVSPLSQPNYGS